MKVGLLSFEHSAHGCAQRRSRQSHRFRQIDLALHHDIESSGDAYVGSSHADLNGPPNVSSLFQVDVVDVHAGEPSVDER